MRNLQIDRVKLSDGVSLTEAAGPGYSLQSFCPARLASKSKKDFRCYPSRGATYIIKIERYE